MEQPIETFSFNDTEYNIADVSDKARYILKQIDDLRVQQNKLSFKADQLKVAEQAFSTVLGEELSTPEDTEEVEA
jgi:hypothetical protein